MDVFDKKTRSRIMRSVRVTRTEPEERLASALRELGLRFRRNDRHIFGKPDFVFRAERLAVFIDGDFWHGRAWIERGEAPASNAKFWIAKFERNERRDRVVDKTLRQAGWSVLRFWGSDMRSTSISGARLVRSRLRRLSRRRAS
jgi:DNA mismatch endonuclease (patch repair protein)